MSARIVAAVIAVILGIGAAQAQTDAARWPQRPIRLIVPFTAGSSSDTVARLVAAKLAERLRQQLVVENRVGGSGNVGTEAVVRADPDGSTLGLGNTSTLALAASLGALGYDPLTDLAAVSMHGHTPFVLAARPGQPAHSIGELIALARGKPRELSYASAGPATFAHLAAVLFEQTAGITLTHVPYRGTAQSTLDLIEGRVDMQFGTIPPALAYLRAGKLNALAVTGGARNAALPDVPTMAEAGLAGYECILWQALVAPAATPAAIIARLNREVGAVLAEPELRAMLAEQGIEPAPGTPEALAARMRADARKWREVIAERGIRER